MPFLTPEDTSTDLNRILEFEVSAALEDENKRSCQESGRNEKKAGPSNIIKSGRVDHYVDQHSPNLTSVDVGIPTVVTPDSRGSKKHLSLPSLFFDSSTNTTNTKFQLRPIQVSSESGNPKNDISHFPPLLSSDSDEPHPGDEIAFEGEHFHYLDSFVAQAPTQFFSLALKNDCNLITQQNHNIVPYRPLPIIQSELTTQPRQVGINSSPLIECDLPESTFSIARSLREPIMSPCSSSSSSLDDIFKQEGTLQIDTDTIFSDDFGGDWEIGKYTSMDAYFL